MVILAQQPDYSQELKAIAAALNHPATPAWIVAAFSASLGVIGGLLGQFVFLRINDAFQRFRMRRILYKDLGATFLMIYTTLIDQFYTGYRGTLWQQQQFAALLTFSVEDYLKQRPDVYMQLSEYKQSEELYRWLHNTAVNTPTGCSNPAMYCQLFADYVSNSSLKEKYFRKFFNEPQAETLIKYVAEAKKRTEDLAKDVAAGRVSTVDGFQSDN